ncbi:MAG: class I SAM-dependent methyltransferase [Chlamydiae bacterium]|nr:class I SAM-dependent methyltransferase [Chlamydiota bacterium]
MIRWYGLDQNSSVLQIGSDKGFLLEAFRDQLPYMNVYGVEISDYAISCTSPEIREKIVKAPFTHIPFDDKKFDLVIAIGPVYSLSLADAIQCLKEIKRVGKQNSFITLGAYENQSDKNLFNNWTLLGTTILSKKEWVYVLNHVGYEGDYKFNTAASLGLVSAD